MTTKMLSFTSFCMVLKVLMQPVVQLSTFLPLVFSIDDRDYICMNYFFYFVSVYIMLILYKNTLFCPINRMHWLKCSEN